MRAVFLIVKIKWTYHSWALRYRIGKWSQSSAESDVWSWSKRRADFEKVEAVEFEKFSFLSTVALKKIACGSYQHSRPRTIKTTWIRMGSLSLKCTKRRTTSKDNYGIIIEDELARWNLGMENRIKISTHPKISTSKNFSKGMRYAFKMNSKEKSSKFCVNRHFKET